MYTATFWNLENSDNFRFVNGFSLSENFDTLIEIQFS